MDGLISLFKSRKAVLALAGIIVTVILLSTGQIDGDTAITAIAGMLSTLIIAIAAEDAAEKHGVKITTNNSGD